jgi:hypothetical protein
VKDASGVVSTIALSPVLEVLRRRRSATTPRGDGGLDGTEKMSKDMAMTAMPRIGARWGCVNWGLRGG